MPPTAQRQTADRLVAAFNRMDIPAIISFRHPDCIRQILPASLNIKPQNNATYEKSLHQLIVIFQNFNLEAHEVVEDIEARKLTMWLSARADTAAGEYINEYMWTLDFDESGQKILRQKEFVDAVVNKEFFPKLQAAMDQARIAKAARAS